MFKARDLKPLEEKVKQLEARIVALENPVKKSEPKSKKGKKHASGT